METKNESYRPRLSIEISPEQARQLRDWLNEYLEEQDGFEKTEQ